jgi:hypothetical protein
MSKYFKIQEFVPVKVYEKFGDKAWWFIDPKIVQIADAIREHFGKSMMINYAGLQYRGFRDDSFYENKRSGLFSQHRFGRAIDFNIKDISTQEVYAEILKNEQKFLSLGLTTMEDVAFTPTWCHVDCRHTGLNKILIVKP